MKRENLIAYAYKYGGEYDQIIKAIKKHEKIDVYYPNDNCITILDDDYPSNLRYLTKPPLVLFYKGDKRLLKERIVAVVGSRKNGDYAKRMSEKLCHYLYQKYVVVSGMALGIDGIVHRVNLNRSIAVLGSGIKRCYPALNSDIYDNIALIISEYPEDTKPYKHHFVMRNRIIAALCESLFVMEASLKSGSLITVSCALELNKEIYALPYRIDDSKGFGTNLLIQEGANIILLEDMDNY